MFPKHFHDEHGSILSVACGTDIASGIRSVESADAKEERLRRRRECYRRRRERETNKVRKKAEFLTPPTHLYHHVSVLYTCPYTFLPITVHVMA